MLAILPGTLFVFFKHKEKELAKQEDPKILPKLWKIPNYTFTDQQGKPFSQDDLNNTIYVADFFFTSCPGICPTLTADLKKVQNKFYSITQREPDFKFKIISYTVDPKRDNPEKLAKYAAKYGAEYNMWRFLTGPQDSIYSIAEHGYKAAVQQDSGSVEEFTHSGKIFLVDKNGYVRKFYDGTDGFSLDTLANDVLRLSVEKN